MSSRYRAAAIILLATLLIGSGAGRLQFDDDYRLVFRSHGDDYGLLLELFRDFGTDEADVIVVLEADDVTTPERLAAVDQLEAALYESGVAAEVISLLAVPSRHTRRPVFVPGVPESEALVAARAEARAHPLLVGNLLASDLRTTIVVVRLTADLADDRSTRAGLQTVRDVMHRTTGSFERARITGVPAIREAVRVNSLNSQVRYALVGGGIASLICWFLFRALGVMIAVGLGAGTAVLWTLGVLGWGGGSLNLLNHLVIELVLVIAFTDAVHLAFHIRRRRNAGWSPGDAARDAIRELWLACALTSITTAIGFGSLAFAQLAVVRNFGLVCAVGTAIGFLAVLAVVPTASLFFPAAFRRPPPRIATLDPSALAPVLWHHARPIAGLVLAIGVAAAWFGAGVSVDYRYRDFAPTGDEAVAALEHNDAAIGGTLPLRVLVEFPDSMSPTDERAVAFLGEVEEALAASPLSTTVLSLLDVLDPSGLSPERQLAALPTSIRQRLVRPDIGRALVSTRWPDTGAATHVPELAAVRSRLDQLGQAEPGFKATATGIVAVSATTSTRTISDLARSLAIATSLIFIVMLAALRSWRLAAISVVANAVPLVGAAAVLRAVGLPLGYSTVLVFSICLGIAVDDTVHFLVRYRRALSGNNELEAIRVALQRVGPVLIVTTAILLGGFGALLTGRAPAEVQMGFLSCVALLLALATDLFILPALLGVTTRSRGVGLRRAGAALIALGLVGTAGCSAQRLGQSYAMDLASHTEAAVADETDYEIARHAAMSMSVSLEGMARHEPGNVEIALAAARAYRGIALGFAELDHLRAEEHGSERTAAARAAMLYGRVREHAKRALNLLGLDPEEDVRWPDVLEAESVAAASVLYATGLAGQLRLQPGAGSAEDVARLAALLDALVETVPTTMHASPLVLRAGFRAAAPLHRGGDREGARQDFQRALAITGRRALVIQVLYAELYCTETNDRSCFERLLDEVAAANSDVLPGERLMTVVAKLRAEELRRRIDAYFVDE